MISFKTSSDALELRIETSMILIAGLCMLAAQADALAPTARCVRVASLRAVTRTLAQTANLLLICAAIIGNSSLVQIYLWYTLAFIVVGFPLALSDLLVGIKQKERWCVPNFLSEVVFLFVLSRCLPLVDMYRKQLSEPVLVKYAD